jgi:hypothetical protein
VIVGMERWRSVWVWSKCRGCLNFATGGMCRVSGATRDCLISKCVCRVSRIVWGLEMIFLVPGTVIVARLGWSLAIG